MGDLVLAAIALATVSLVAMLIGVRVAGQWPGHHVFWLGAIVLSAYLVYLFRYHGTWQMARLLPFSGVILLGNWIPIGGAFFAGLVLGQKDAPPWRRCCLAGLILLASGYSVACCFLGHLPMDRGFSGRTSLSQQSRRSSCGACCVAALLNHHGIQASEEELLNLCLTSYRGSPALGLYRGLKLKTAGTDWDVEVVTCPVEKLLNVRGPLLLRVALADEDIIEDKGVHRRVNFPFEHAILLLDADAEGHVHVFDPAIEQRCQLPWRIDDLRKRWPGEALRLVRKKGNPGNA